MTKDAAILQLQYHIASIRGMPDDVQLRVSVNITETPKCPKCGNIDNFMSGNDYAECSNCSYSIDYQQPGGKYAQPQKTT